MTDEQKPPLIPMHAVPPAPPDNVRKLPPPPPEEPGTEIVRLLRVVAAGIKNMDGKINLLRAETQELWKGLAVLEEGLNHIGKQGDVHTQALDFLVVRARGG